MFAAHHRLANLVADRRPQRPAGARLHDATCSTSTPLAERWRAFGWDVHEVDGHDPARSPARSRALDTDGRRAPHVLLARTIVRQGRLVHGGPDQVALLADVGRRQYRQALRRDRMQVARMRAAFVQTLAELAERRSRGSCS